MVDMYSSIPFFVIGTLISSYLVAFAYQNTKFVLKHKIAIKRDEAIVREMHKKLAEDKKMSKKEKDERTLWHKNEVSDYEATAFSIFYNNALYLAIVIVTSFYAFSSFMPMVNYSVSVTAGAGLLALFSTGTK